MRQIALLARACLADECWLAGIDMTDGRLRRLLYPGGAEIPREQLFLARGASVRVGDVIALEEVEETPPYPHVREALICLPGQRWELVRHLPPKELARLCRPRRHKYLFYNEEAQVSGAELQQVPQEYYYSLLLTPAEGAELYLEEGEIRFLLTYNGTPYRGLSVGNGEILDWAMTHYELFDMERIPLPERSLLLFGMADRPNGQGLYEKRLRAILRT